jgi:asparagine synthase (glutamine-hydrolysing)
MELAASLPGQYKIKRGRTKHVLREAVRGLIPDEVIDRPKEGFVLPIDDWLLGGLRGLVTEALSPGHLSRHGLLRPCAVQELLADHFAGRANHGPRIWALVMFQLWWDRYVG